jgi:GTPase SAR1 family protein
MAVSVPNSLKASIEGLERIDKARRRMGLSRTRSETWWLEAEVSQSTLRRFWSSRLIRRENFVAICRAVGIERWQDIVDWDSVQEEMGFGEPGSEEPGSEEPGLEEPGSEKLGFEGPRSEGPRSERPRSEGPRSEGPRSEGPRSEGPRSEGPRSEGPRSEELRPEETGLREAIQRLEWAAKPLKWAPKPQGNSPRQVGSATRPLSQPAILPDFPDGPVALGSPFYVERQPLEERCFNALQREGALIRIKGPRQMGKTSLLNRLCHQAREQGYRTVRLNLARAESSVFMGLDRLLRWLCNCINEELGLNVAAREVWEDDRGSIINCMHYIQAQVLEPSGQPMVLALDEVDTVFPMATISQDFFSMLRSWHEEAKTLDVWGKLRLIVVHSTELYGQLDINKSPFNVGFPVGLTELTLAEIEQLIQAHGLSAYANLAQELSDFAGGHPHLIRLALYDLAWQKATHLDQLLAEAQCDLGIYADMLRHYLQTLKTRPELAQAFREVLRQPVAVTLDPLLAYQLYSMGLVRREGDRVSPRSQLYRQYFGSRIDRLAEDSP